MSEFIAKIKKLIASKKKKHPRFRPRFGVKSVRKPSKKKWSKWRKPRGIDIKWEKADGKKPSIGYKQPKDIRNLHPSGYKEVIVRNIKDLENIDANKVAIRIASGVGSKKRNLIISEAEKKKIHILNKSAK